MVLDAAMLGLTLVLLAISLLYIWGLRELP
jgi:hypothetical protein